jgi:hypothetical protein
VATGTSLSPYARTESLGKNPRRIRHITRMCYGPVQEHCPFLYWHQLWKWRQYVPPICWYPNTSSQGVTIQKTTIDIWDLRFLLRWRYWSCSSGFGRRVDWLVQANVSEKRTVSIFRAEVTMMGIRVNKKGGRKVSLRLQPWRWRQYASPKRWLLPASQHSAQTQNNIISINIFTAVRIENILPCTPTPPKCSTDVFF